MVFRCRFFGVLQKICLKYYLIWGRTWFDLNSDFNLIWFQISIWFDEVRLGYDSISILIGTVFLVRKNGSLDRTNFTKNQKRDWKFWTKRLPKAQKRYKQKNNGIWWFDVNTDLIWWFDWVRKSTRETWSPIKIVVEKINILHSTKNHSFFLTRKWWWLFITY